MASQEQFGKGNLWGSLKSLFDNRAGWYTGSVAPTDGTTLAGHAGIGAVYVNLTTGYRYVNIGTLSSPIWSSFNLPVQGLGGLGVVGNAKMSYRFGTDGGAIATITPANSPTLPIGAIILGGTIDITVQLTSGGAATIALGLGSGAQVASLKGATAVASWTVGQLALVPVFTAATYVRVAAATRLTLTVAAFALTAGEFSVNVVYVKGN